VRVIAEWEANGRRLAGTKVQTPTDLTLNEVMAAYAEFAEGYYVKNGKPTKQLERVKRSLRYVKQSHGHILAKDFGPLALKAVRQKMIEAGWTRIHVNHCVGCIKRMFKWGVENELVPSSVWHGLQCVSGLKKGRSEAREGGKVLPVPDAVVDATLPFLLVPVRALVQLQRLTGMRPGEAVIMRPRDIDRSRPEVWVYRPGSHKTEHHGYERVVFLGKKAQEVLMPFLFRDPDAYLFSPAEGVQQRYADLRTRRKSKVQPSQQSRKKRKPRRQPGTQYDVHTYAHAVTRGINAANKDRACDSCKKLQPVERCAKCQAAAIPHWHPHQLRHTHGTEVRKRFGLEGAQVALGHANASITELYAERDLSLAEKIAREIG
jgi:integrase